MDRDHIVEMMARAMAENDALDFNSMLHPMRSMYRSHARAALSALEAAGLVVVPMEATREMVTAAWLAPSDSAYNFEAELPNPSGGTVGFVLEYDNKGGGVIVAAWDAMISAALGEKGEADGR